MNSAPKNKTSSGHVKATGPNVWESIDKAIKPLRMQVVAGTITTEVELQNRINQLVTNGYSEPKLREALGRHLEPTVNYTEAEIKRVNTDAMKRARTGV
jgi:hypothetical protein